LKCDLQRKGDNWSVTPKAESGGKGRGWRWHDVLGAATKQVNERRSY